MQNYDIKNFFDRITIYQHSALSKDGKKLAYISNITGAPQVWVGEIHPDSPKLLFPKPVTTATDQFPHVMAPALEWIGNDKLVVTLDRHGDEKTKISIIDFKEGIHTEIPQGKGRDYLGFVSEDKKTLYFSSNRDDLRYQGLYTYDLKTKEVVKQYVAENRWSTWTIPTPWKGSYFFIEAIANTSMHLKRINLKTKEVTDVFVKENTTIQPVALLPKDRLLVTTNFGREFMSLAILSLKSGELEYFQKDAWDVEFAKLSQDKKNLFVVRNAEAESRLEHYSFPSFNRLKTQFKKGGIISSVDYLHKEKTLIVGYMSPTEPKNFYHLSLKSKKIDRLTDTWCSIVPESKMVNPKSVWYLSGDTQIHSLLFLPKLAKKNGKNPIIVWPHGGPQAQERKQFRPIFQYFLSKGFAIWAPNHRGSTGYGMSFCKQIERAWGTADLPDMLNGIDWLKKSGWIDPDKMTIMGGSYGGYMTLRSITKIPKTFKAAVDIFGVSNLLTFCESVPEDWKFSMNALVGHPINDKQMLIEQSPINALNKIDCPLLVIQGALDPRVVKSESDQVVGELKAMNKEVEYLLFDDEGHGFFKPENELKAFRKAAEFLEKFIK